MLRTVILLIASNVFMTFAWYGHLKQLQRPLPLVILTSWLIAFFEYSLQVPANRHGFISGLSATQLKTIQEVISLIVFVLFASFYLKVQMRGSSIVGFAFIAIGAGIVFHSFRGSLGK